MLNMLWSEAKAGPSTEPSETVRPPASTTAMVCAAAICRLHRRASSRSGWAIGRMVPEVGAGADDDLAAGAVSRRTASSRCRTETAGLVNGGDVVRADHDQGDVGLLGQRPVDLLVQLAGLRPGDGDPHQPDGALGQLGERRGDEHPGGLRGALDAQADGGGVAEDGEHERLAARPRP